MIILNCLSKWKLSLKKWWAKFRLRECIKSEQSLYQKDLDKLVLERPRLLDMDRSADALMFFGHDQLGNSLLIQLLRRRRRETEVWLILRLEDGRTFTLPDHPDTQIFNVRGDAFVAAGLSMETMIPFITTRITFNGLLRPTVRKKWSSDYDEGELVEVRFNFNFSAKTKPLYWPYDWNLELMASALAMEQWDGLSFLGMLTEPDSRGYDQYGAMRGEIYLGWKGRGRIRQERIELNLPGLKMRRWGPLPSSLLTEMGYLIAVCADGMVFIVGAFSSKEGLKHAQFGSIIHPNGLWDTIKWTDFQLAEFSSDNSLRNSLLINFRVNSRLYHVEVKTQRRSNVRLIRGRPIDWTTDCYSVSLVVNGENGFGVRITSRLEAIPGYGPTAIVPIYKTLSYYSLPPDPDKFIYLFYEETARSVAISGGKGASLAMLSILALSTDIADSFDAVGEEMQRHRRVVVAPPRITIPEGFTVSSSALQKTIQTNITIEKAIERLMAVAGAEQDIQLNCAEVSALINFMDMDTEIAHAVVVAFRTLRESAGGKRKDFAVSVRPSVTTEDTSEVSAAGQIEAVLGLSGEREVLAAIKQCWASLYSFKSVQYRRQTVQPINTGMAVVVQRMVAVDCAGVLFTHNPSTGDPQESFILANYGLGGSFRSGDVDPDRYFVSRSYDSGYLTVSGRKVGSKKYVLQVGKKGTVQRRSNTTKGASLTNEMAVVLARVGVVLERLYGLPMDIEWAVKGDEIFILQCRPLTTGNAFSDWELTHEFDSAVMSQEDLYTTANVDEVLRNAVTLPTMFFLSMADRVLKKHLDGDKRPEWNVNRFMPCFNYHVFIDVFNFNLRYNRKEKTVTDVVMGYALMGKEYLTPEIHKTALKRYPSSSMKNLKLIYHILTARDYAGLSDTIIGAFRNYYSKENLMDFESALDLLNDMEGNFWRLQEACRYHYKASLISTFYDAIAILSLTDRDPFNSPEVQGDVRLLLSGINGTVSGAIPKALEDLMRMIVLSGKKVEFCSVDRVVGVEWLRINIPEAGTAFDEFIKEHRHRGMEEMELFSTTWGMDPGILIQMLQQGLWHVGTADELNNYKAVVHRTASELVSQLRISRSCCTNLVLRSVISRAKRAVLAREVTKSNLISCLFEFRLAIRYLGGLMMREGLLTTADLLFFMTPAEWRTVIAEKNLSAVRKAVQRMRIFGQLNETQFNEFSFGVPLAARRTVKVTASSVAVKGISICAGVVTGRAAVIKDLSETWKVQAGDIIITRGTDIIGWSPYFPIIRGIVTELGGLLSHGTIVAREYGLPCIVAASDATLFFQHGERVTLDAENGVIFRESSR